MYHLSLLSSRSSMFNTSLTNCVVIVHCRLKQSVTSPAYVENHHASVSSDVSAMKSIANEALTKMLAIDKCDVTKISPLYGAPDLQFKSSVSRVKMLSCMWVTLVYSVYEVVREWVNCLQLAVESS